MAGASTLPRLWDDFLFKGIGDHSHNPLAGIEGSELATVLSDEVLQDPGTTARKAEMVNQWVQGGSLDVLNPFMPIQEVSSVEISSNGKTGGSATSSARGDTSRFVASTSFETQEPNRPPSPRKRFGKVRKPKGGKATQSLEGKDVLPEDIAATRVTNQGVGLNEELQPDPRVVEEVLSGMNQTEEAGHVEDSRVESEPDRDRKNSQSIHLPPEILPPFTSPATAETVQDSSPDQVPVWEKQHAHAAVVGRLVDVSAPSTKSQDVEEPPGYKQSLIPNRVGSSEFTGLQPDRLPDVSEDEYPALPSRSVEMKTRPSLVDTPILPLRTKTRTLRIVQNPGSMPDSSLAADSVTSKSET
ncbi:MAG: hypothetical protein M1830_007752, partial [Pleopsidium flavum]